jgi:2-haloacid dehalogenase
MSITVRVIAFDAFETLLNNQQTLWFDTMDSICKTQGLNIESSKLWDTWIRHERAFRNHRVNHENPRLSPLFSSYWKVWRNCFELAFGELGLTGNAVDAANVAIHDLSRRHAYDDAKQLLKHLSAGPWKLLVLSNADDSFLLPPLHDNGFIFPHGILSSESTQVYKPHPAIYEKLIDTAECLPEDIVYVGDSPLEDIHGPKSHGMHAIFINRHGRDWEEGLLEPDYEIKSLLEITGLLEYPDN